MSPNTTVLISHFIGEKKNSWEENLIAFVSTLMNKIYGHTVDFIYSRDIENESHLKEKISESSAFIVLLNQNYLTSDFAMKELNSIVEKVKESNKKLFKVLQKDISFYSQPENIRYYLSYNFELPKDQNILIEKQIIDIERHFWLKLTDLVFDLRHYLSIESKNEPVSVIYLAETTLDQEYNRESIKRELKRLGFKILPDETLPEENEDFRKKVLSYLEQSFLSIHIFGNIYGNLVRDNEYSISDYQNRIAAEYFDTIANDKDRKFIRLIWLSPDLKIQNEKQRQFLDQLKRDTDLLKGASLIQTPLEYFKTIILSEINQLEVTDKTIQNPERKRIYLIHESLSFEKISDISIFLSNFGFEIIHSPHLSEEKNLLKKHRQNLVDSDAVLIYYDSGDDFWLKSKANDLVKAPGFGRSKPFIIKAVYIDSPLSVPIDFFQKRGIELIEGKETFNVDLLTMFVEKMGIVAV